MRAVRTIRYAAVLRHKWRYHVWTVVNLSLQTREQPELEMGPSGIDSSTFASPAATT